MLQGKIFRNLDSPEYYLGYTVYRMKKYAVDHT